MRIAYLVNMYPMTSQTFIRREIAALEAHGLEVLRFALRPWHTALVNELDQREARQTRYTQKAGLLRIFAAVIAAAFLSPLRFFGAMLLTWRCARRSDRSFLRHAAYLVQACVLVRWLKAEKVQHLHAHFGTNSTDVAMLSYVLGGPRYSFTVHGPEAIDRACVLNYEEKIGRAAFVAAISHFTCSQLFRQIPYEYWERIKVVRCGLDAGFLEFIPKPIPEVARLVCIGRLCEQKGQLLLVEAARRLREEGVPCEVVLVGGGEMQGAVEALVERHDLAESVRLVGWADTPEVQSWIERSRALVLASFGEGLPVVIMEALAMGRPVLSTYIAGIPELVDPACGWLIPAGSVEGLIEGMRQALSCDLKVAEAKGAEGRRRVLEQHDSRKEARKLAALIAEAAGLSLPVGSPEAVGVTG